MKQTWKSCWRVHIALLLNFLPPEVEKTQQIQEKHLFWSHLVLILCESVGIALSHLKEMFLATNFFVWPLWAITDLPAFFPTFSPKITPTQPCSWPCLPWLSTFMICYVHCTLCFGLWCCCYFPKSILFLAVRLRSCTVFWENSTSSP